MRKAVILLVALAALLGALVAAFASIQQRHDLLRGYVDPTQDADLPFWQPRLGINAELTQYSPQELPEQLGLMRQANINWVRQFFYWNEIEPERGTYDWEKWDRVVAAFETQQDLKLV